MSTTQLRADGGDEHRDADEQEPPHHVDELVPAACLGPEAVVERAEAAHEARVHRRGGQAPQLPRHRRHRERVPEHKPDQSDGADGE